MGIIRKKGELHRDNDKPTVIMFDGTKRWYQNDKLHRVDGPALEKYNGTKKWIKNNMPDYFFLTILI